MSHHDYANPSALVEADWAQEHLSDPNVRFIEVVRKNVDLAALVLTAVVEEVEKGFASPGAEPFVL